MLVFASSSVSPVITRRVPPGIGAPIAKRLTRNGASVALTYATDDKAASAVIKAIERNGGKAGAIQADVADVEAVKSAIKRRSRRSADWVCL